MKLNLIALKGPDGLFSYAITPASDGADIIKSISNSLDVLFNNITSSSIDEIKSYCELLLASDIVLVLDFNIFKAEVNTYYTTLRSLSSIEEIYDKILLILATEVE